MSKTFNTKTPSSEKARNAGYKQINDLALSIVERIGVGYSWTPTIVFVAVGIVVSLAPLILGGVPLYLIATDLLSWMALVVLFIPYVVRGTLKDFDLTLEKVHDTGVFPEEEKGDNKEETKKNKRETETTKEKDYWALARGVMGRWQKVAWGVGLAMALFIVLQPWNWQMKPFGGLDYRGVVNGFTAARDYLVLAWVMGLAFFLGVDIALIIGMIINGTSLPKIALNQNETNVNSIKGSKSDTLAVDTHFFDVHSAVTDIGEFMYRLCVKLILGGFIIVLAFIVYDMLFTSAGQVSLNGIFVSIFVMLGVFTLFVLPQMSVHKSLKEAKNKTLKELRKHYGAMQRDLIASIKNPKNVQKETKFETSQELIDHATALDNLVNHVQNMGDWSFSWPTALKLLAAAAVPLLTALLQFAASGLLGQLASAI